MNQTDKIQLNPYEKLYGRELSESEMAEIDHNLLGYFTVLMKVDKRLRSQSDEQNNRGTDSPY
ncbi:MAG: hypothetical protein WCP91_01875 [Candidatus Berkelbacteria bacterium]